MIDVTLPLELEDGTPVVYKGQGSSSDTIIVEVPDCPYGEVSKHITRVFRLSDGTHYWLELPKLRNKKLNDVTTLTDQELANELRAVDDRYHDLLKELNKRSFTVLSVGNLELVEARVGKISKEEIL